MEQIGKMQKHSTRAAFFISGFAAAIIWAILIKFSKYLIESGGGKSGSLIAIPHGMSRRQQVYIFLSDCWLFWLSLNLLWRIMFFAKCHEKDYKVSVYIDSSVRLVILSAV